MLIEGRLIAPKKGEKFWTSEIPALGIFSQGKSAIEAASMAAEAIHDLQEKRSFKVSVFISSAKEFYIKADKAKPFMAFILSRMRMTNSLSVREVSKRLGSRSPNSVGRYERPTTAPSVEKFESIISKIDPKAVMVLKRLDDDVA